MADDFTFEFVEFNPRRAKRGARAARVAVNGNEVWMSVEDLKKNVAIFGPLDAITEALKAYITAADFDIPELRVPVGFFACPDCPESVVTWHCGVATCDDCGRTSAD